MHLPCHELQTRCPVRQATGYRVQYVASKTRCQIMNTSVGEQVCLGVTVSLSCIVPRVTDRLSLLKRGQHRLCGRLVFLPCLSTDLPTSCRCYSCDIVFRACISAMLSKCLMRRLLTKRSSPTQEMNHE